MRAVRAEHDADLVEFNGEADHVHLLVTYPPTLAISALVQRLKGRTAYAVRREFTGRCVRARMRGHLWSPSYFAVSCAGAPLSIIKQYLDGQARPSKRRAPPGDRRDALTPGSSPSLARKKVPVKSCLTDFGNIAAISVADSSDEIAYLGVFFAPSRIVGEREPPPTLILRLPQRPDEVWIGGCAHTVFN